MLYEAKQESKAYEYIKSILDAEEKEYQAYMKIDSNMNTEKLERGNILAKSLIPKVNVLLSIPSDITNNTADALWGLVQCDEEFKTKFKQLLNETKQRFQKEFDEL